MDEFEPRRSAAYVSQHDLHMGELTVRETVNFSAKCQGIGHRYGKKQKNEKKNLDNGMSHGIANNFLKKCSDLLMELSRREKEENIKPDPEVDIYLKVQCSSYITIHLIHKLFHFVDF